MGSNALSDFDTLTTEGVIPLSRNTDSCMFVREFCFHMHELPCKHFTRMQEFFTTGVRNKSTTVRKIKGVFHIRQKSQTAGVTIPTCLQIVILSMVGYGTLLILIESCIM